MFSRTGCVGLLKKGFVTLAVDVCQERSQNYFLIIFRQKNGVIFIQGIKISRKNQEVRCR